MKLFTFALLFAVLAVAVSANEGFSPDAELEAMAYLDSVVSKFQTAVASVRMIANTARAPTQSMLLQGANDTSYYYDTSGSSSGSGSSSSSSTSSSDEFVIPDATSEECSATIIAGFDLLAASNCSIDLDELIGDDVEAKTDAEYQAIYDSYCPAQAECGLLLSAYRVNITASCSVDARTLPEIKDISTGLRVFQELVCYQDGSTVCIKSIPNFLDFDDALDSDSITTADLNGICSGCQRGMFELLARSLDISLNPEAALFGPMLDLLCHKDVSGEYCMIFLQESELFAGSSSSSSFSSSSSYYSSSGLGFPEASQLCHPCVKYMFKQLDVILATTVAINPTDEDAASAADQFGPLGFTGFFNILCAQDGFGGYCLQTLADVMESYTSQQLGAAFTNCDSTAGVIEARLGCCSDWMVNGLFMMSPEMAPIRSSLSECWGSLHDPCTTPKFAVTATLIVNNVNAANADATLREALAEDIADASGVTVSQVTILSVTSRDGGASVQFSISDFESDLDAEFAVANLSVETAFTKTSRAGEENNDYLIAADEPASAEVDQSQPVEQSGEYDSPNSASFAAPSVAVVAVIAAALLF